MSLESWNESYRKREAELSANRVRIEESNLLWELKTWNESSVMKFSELHRTNEFYWQLQRFYKTRLDHWSRFQSDYR